MPMKLNVGLSRKVGEPNYSSRGASMNLELELDSSLVEEPERLRERIRQLYQLAKLSVDEELNGNGHRHQEGTGHGNGFDRYRAGDSGSGNGNGHRPESNAHSPRRATSSRVKAIHSVLEFHFTELLCGNDLPSHEVLLDVFQQAWRNRTAEHKEIRFGKGENHNSLSTKVFTGNMSHAEAWSSRRCEAGLFSVVSA